MGYAKMPALDWAKFRQDVQSDKVKERVAGDQKRAAKLGVTVTPTVFLNDKALTGRRSEACTRRWQMLSAATTVFISGLLLATTPPPRE